MTAPDHVSIKQTEGYEYNWWGVVTDEFDEDGTKYIRADLHAALQAENERLREALTRRAILDIERLVDWLDEDEDNAELLLANLTPEQIEIARTALK